MQTALHHDCEVVAQEQQQRIFRGCARGNAAADRLGACSEFVVADRPAVLAQAARRFAIQLFGVA